MTAGVGCDSARRAPCYSFRPSLRPRCAGSDGNERNGVVACAAIRGSADSWHVTSATGKETIPLAIQPTDLAKHLAGYEPTERIGAGGYGEVWKSSAPGGLLKAIKFVYGFLDDVRAAGELKSLNRIRDVRHPFLLSLERIEIIDGQLVIITELADACLKDRFEECRKAELPGVPREELLVYLGDAADALDYMREKFSLQHLDVKPENLLLLGGRVKVGDFGLVKELSEVTASLLGGLTPVYAPPELFDGRPSVHSDQYSLAIVYQEMLTGTLPFPGRTTAQLAAQHLNAAPRLGSLPAGDQDVLRRSLAKNPNDRFASCRDMVNRLLAVGRAPQSSPWPQASDPVSRGKSNGGRENDTRGRRLSDLVRDFQPKWTKALQTQDAGEQTLGGAATEYFPASGGEGPQSTTTNVEVEIQVRDLPPIAEPSQSEVFRPTLFLGIGHAAGEVLVRVRRQLGDRFGDLNAIPALQMLLIDTDRKALLDKTVCRQGLPQSATLALPLRKSTDYRADSKKFLKWLSRRWLFNIPRSLLTEGRRPLGRLALVDHNREFFERLVEAITTMCGDEALAASREAAGGAWMNVPPRVYVIAASGGGTGGGMALDAGYAVRFVLEELGLSPDGVHGVLFHASNRHPEARELAAVNSYACLSEWNDYARPGGGFPGDPALGLPAFPEVPPFAHGYFLHLGDELQDTDFTAALDRVAKYVYCDAATSAGGLLDRCRRGQPGEPPDSPPAAQHVGASLRSFGTCSVGAMECALPDTATSLLARMVLLRWSGDWDRVAESRLLADPATDRERKSLAAVSHVGEAVEELAKKMDFDVAAMVVHLERAAATLLGAAPEDRFRQMFAQAEAFRGGAAAGANDAASLRLLDELFGQADAGKSDALGAGSVGVALVRQTAAAAEKQAAALRAWLCELVDADAGGAGGAQQAVAALVERLKSMEKQAADERRDLGPKLRELEQSWGSKRASGGSRVLKSRGHAKADAAASELFAAYGRLRLSEAVYRAIERFAVQCQKPLAALADELRSILRFLQELLRESPVAAPGSSALAEVGLTPIQKAITLSLDQRLPQLAAELDHEFKVAFFGENKPLFDALKEAHETRALCHALHQAARRRVLRSLQETDVVSALLASDRSADAATLAERRLQEYLKAARPKALEHGGARRLLLWLPREADHERLRQAIDSGFQEKSSVALGIAGEAVFCYEAEQIPLPRLAAGLIEYRRDLAEAAARLHSRQDVPWSQLMTC